MNYIEVNFEFTPVSNENREIIAAMLGQIEFDSFSDTKKWIQAYIQESQFSEDLMNDTLENVKLIFDNFNYTITTIEDKNWNAEWEKNFEPIHISEECRIRAPFHSSEPKYKYEIIIEPKMSFGTGHHATTALMMKQILDFDFSNKEVLDMGCGTGVLGILASLKNAKNVYAVDIDNWSFENTIENAERNNIKNISIKKGDASLLVGKHFDVILANINRNILLNDMAMYVNSINNNGSLILSGFYSQDLPIISDKANQLGLKYENHIENDSWVAVKFSKNSI